MKPRISWLRDDGYSLVWARADNQAGKDLLSDMGFVEFWNYGQDPQWVLRAGPQERQKAVRRLQKILKPDSWCAASR